jgi:hypothetical protein
VFAANSSSIRLVMVEGEILVRDGRMTQLDEDSALDEAEEYAYCTFSDAGLSLPRYFPINSFQTDNLPNNNLQKR